MTTTAVGPFDIDIEQALIGALLCETGAYWRVADRLSPEHFYDPFHNRIYATIAKLCGRDRPVTPLTVKASLENDPAFEDLGAGYLSSLARGAPAIPNLLDFARRITELAQRRRIISIGQNMIDAASSPMTADGESAESVANRAADELFDATRANKPGEGPIPIKQLAVRAVQMTENAMNAPASTCLTSGLIAVDSALGGLYRGDLTILGAQTSMGKSALAQHIAFANASVPNAEEVLFFSLEMKAEQVATREVASRAKVSSDRMRRGTVTPDEMDRLAYTSIHFPDLPYRIDGGRRLSVAQIRARTQAMRRRSSRGVSLVVIDHLRFIRPANQRDDERDKIQQVTSDLADMAAEFNVALLLISHVNREFAKRVSQRPVLSDLYGASAIEQNADSVWFIHRESYYLERNPPPDIKGNTARAEWEIRCDKERGWAEIFAAKQRMGPTGTARVKFDEKYTQYADADDQPIQEAMDLIAG